MHHTVTPTPVDRPARSAGTSYLRASCGEIHFGGYSYRNAGRHVRNEDTRDWQSVLHNASRPGRRAVPYLRSMRHGRRGLPSSRATGRGDT